VTDYTQILRKTADYIEEHGWVQRQNMDRDGAVCLVGGVRQVAEPVDFPTMFCLLDNRNHGPHWNDEPGRTAGDVISYLRTATIDDDALADTFGPNWRQVVAVLHRVPSLTSTQCDALADVASTLSSNPPAFYDDPVCVYYANRAAYDAAAATLTTSPVAIQLIGEVAYYVARGRDADPEGYDAVVGLWTEIVGPIPDTPTD
jgi:hypothetical protein